MIGLARQAVGAVVIGLVGWLIGEFVTATPSAPLPACVCGCPAEAHEHYRRGVDCGACGPTVCARYERPSVEHLRAVALAEAALDPDRCACGCGLLGETAELVDGLGPDADLDDLRELARRDAALGRPPLH